MISLTKMFSLLSLLLVLTVLMVQPQQARHALASGGGFPSVKRVQIDDGTNRSIQHEPQYSSWSVWSNGDEKDVVGMNAVIAAIYSTGTRQLIDLNPGKAGGGNSPVKGGWAIFHPKTITDPSIPSSVYSKHKYDGIISATPAVWDKQW